MSPEASVETMILGRPSGSARMPAVMIDVPPPPPMPMMPAMSLRDCDEAGEGDAHRRDRGAAVVAAEHGAAAVWVMAGDFLGG